MMEDTEDGFHLENIILERVEPNSPKWRIVIDGLEQSRPFDVVFPNRFASVANLAWYLRDLDWEAADRIAAQEAEPTTAGYE